MAGGTGAPGANRPGRWRRRTRSFVLRGRGGTPPPFSPLSPWVAMPRSARWLAAGRGPRASYSVAAGGGPAEAASGGCSRARRRSCWSSVLIPKPRSHAPNAALHPGRRSWRHRAMSRAGGPGQRLGRSTGTNAREFPCSRRGRRAAPGRRSSAGVVVLDHERLRGTRQGTRRAPQPTGVNVGCRWGSAARMVMMTARAPRPAHSCKELRHRSIRVQSRGWGAGRICPVAARRSRDVGPSGILGRRPGRGPEVGRQDPLDGVEPARGHRDEVDGTGVGVEPLHSPGGQQLGAHPDPGAGRGTGPGRAISEARGASGLAREIGVGLPVWRRSTTFGRELRGCSGDLNRSGVAGHGRAHSWCRWRPTVSTRPRPRKRRVRPRRRFPGRDVEPREGEGGARWAGRSQGGGGAGGCCRCRRG